MERLQTSNVSISNGNIEELLTSNLLQKFFSDRVVYVTIASADADIGSLKSLHT